MPAVVIMAEGLEGFYKRHGFQILVGYATDGDLEIVERGKEEIVVK